MQCDEIGRHPAADLVLAVGRQHMKGIPGVFAHQLDPRLLLLALTGLEDVDRRIRLHCLQRLRRLLRIELGKIRHRVVRVLEDAGEIIVAQQPVEHLPFAGAELRQDLRDVVRMVVAQLVADDLRRFPASENSEDFILVMVCIMLFRTQAVPPSSDPSHRSGTSLKTFSQRPNYNTFVCRSSRLRGIPRTVPAC